MNAALDLVQAVQRVDGAAGVVGGDDLRARGATDLALALELVVEVSVAPGGDGGPAASVPELWGLREFDARLASALRGRVAYAFHDPRLTGCERLFDGAPTRIDGNRPEMVAPNQVAAGPVFQPARSLRLSAVLHL